MLFDHASYRTFLREVLVERTQRNPGYSLRVMSRQFGMYSSQLSGVMGGKANLSVQSARRIASKLELKPEEADYFCLSVQLETERDPEVRESLLERMQQLKPARSRPIQDLSVDLFRQISDWYHTAILELINLEGVKLDAEVASKMLGISKVEAQVAIDRLERLGLIERSSSGKWIRANNDFEFKSPVKHAAFLAFYRQMFGKISVALDEQAPGRERFGGFQTIPLSKEALPEAEKVFDRFFEEMIHVIRKYPKKTDVYHLSVHFINLTHKKERKS